MQFRFLKFPLPMDDRYEESILYIIMIGRGIWYTKLY